MLRMKATALLALALTVSGVMAADPTITIKTAAPNKIGILGTFTIDNPDKLTLKQVEFICLQKTGGKHRTFSMPVVGGKAPDIETPVGGEQNYDCLAILTFTDGTTDAKVASALKTNVFAKGIPKDNVDYGKLTNKESIVKDSVELTTTYKASATWKAEAMKNARTWLIPVAGGRFSNEESTEVTAGESWIKTRTGVAKGKYNTLGFLPIESGGSKTTVSAAPLTIEVK